jgi:flagellum-specific ATP synthase
MSLTADTLALLSSLQTMQLTGSVAQVQGLTLRVTDLSLPVGAMVRIQSAVGSIPGEVVGFDHQQTIVMPLGDTVGIRRGDRVHSESAAPLALVSPDMLGRVINGLGQPVDGKGPLRELLHRPLRPAPLPAMDRIPIDQPLATGVRAIDTLLTAGKGQRLGIFAGPGIGKSTLLSMMCRNTDADISVVALIGERGREVQEFLAHSLGARGLQRTIVVTATGDEPALLRIRAALLATSIAEFFREQGLDVLLLMDSVTRFAQAMRQVGLAAGEPPATRGYTPSVFAALPALLERSGRTRTGSITGFYTILVEGDDLTEPISDACRGILDGHLVLSRDIANKGHWPAIDVLQSISRVAKQVTDRAHDAARQQVLRLVSAYRDVEDLVNIGAYAAGSNPDFDLAIEMKPAIDMLLQQRSDDGAPLETSRRLLAALSNQINQHTLKLKRKPGAAAPAPAA